MFKTLLFFFHDNERNADRGAVGSSITSDTALWSLSKTIYLSLVLVRPRKTRPCLTERLLMGRKESNKIILMKYIWPLTVQLRYTMETK